MTVSSLKISELHLLTLDHKVYKKMESTSLKSTGNRRRGQIDFKSKKRDFIISHILDFH